MKQIHLGRVFHLNYPGLKDKIVFGMGGYSSFPVCIAATILRIPFIIYENNLHIGKANRYLLPYARKVFVSNKELEGIPNPNHTNAIKK